MRKASAPQTKTSTTSHHTSRNSRDSWFEERYRNARGSSFTVPPAIRKGKSRAVDKMFNNMKVLLEDRLPLYSFDEIAKYRLPHYVIFLQQLYDSGYQEVVEEIREIVAKEQQAMGDEEFYTPLLYNKDRLEDVADQLLDSVDLFRSGHIFQAIEVRQGFAEEILLSQNANEIWLSQHLYHSCVPLAERISDATLRLHTKCELHCILGYLELERGLQGGSQAALADLEASRKESKDKDWIVQSPVICLKIKKPINLYGLREDYEEIQGRSMTVHSVVTLLIFQALSSKVGELIFSPTATQADINAAQLYAEDALKMALESRQWIAMSSGYLLVGVIHLKRGDFDMALHHFSHYLEKTILRCDCESEAIALNMLGCCHLGKKDPINALECFAWEKDVAESRGMEDLVIDGVQNIAQVLLAEGQTLEAEACCFFVNQNIRELEKSVMNEKNLINNAWARFGISAGLNTWSRMAAHCRRSHDENLNHVTKWKGSRRLMPLVSQVAFRLPLFNEVYPGMHANANMATITTTDSEIYRFICTNKSLLKRISSRRVPFGEDSSTHILFPSQERGKQSKRVGYCSIPRHTRATSLTGIPSGDSDVSIAYYESDRRRHGPDKSKLKKMFTTAVASVIFHTHKLDEETDDHPDAVPAESTRSEGSFKGGELDEMISRPSRVSWSTQKLLGIRRSTHGGITLANSFAEARDTMYKYLSAESLAHLNKIGIDLHEKLSSAELF